MFRLLAYLLLIMPHQCLAQVSDDFSDGDFTANPTWVGDETLFVVNSNCQLQLNAEAAGDASLFCDVDVSSDVHDGEYEWRFWLKEAFAPSGNNFCDVFLCSNYLLDLERRGVTMSLIYNVLTVQKPRAYAEARIHS